MNFANNLRRNEEVEMSEPTVRLEPPRSTRRERKDVFSKILQIIFLLLITLPIVVYRIVEDIFITRPKCLKGKVVLVTGAGRGLGRGFALKFAKLGCKVACVDIDETTNKETVQMVNEEHPGNAKGYKCDVCLTKEIRALREAVYEDFGRVDILVNNAGIISGCPITDCEDVYVHGMIATNLTSHIFTIREFLPDMLKRNEGHIVAVSSLAGFCGLPGETVYGATKHGLIGLMEALHYELQEIPGNKVQTSVIASWFVNTSATYTSWWNLSTPELSISEATDAAIAGIRKNKRIITIPSFIYYAIHFGKLFPDQLYTLGRNVNHPIITFPSINVQKTSLPYKMMMNSMKKIDLGLNGS